MKTHRILISLLALGFAGCLTPPPKSAVNQSEKSASSDGSSSSSSSSSQVPKLGYKWKSVQILGGGFVTGVVFSPIQKDLLYARTDIGGAYRYDPKDQSWISISDQFGRDNANYWGIESLALDPTDPNRLYLACGTYTQDWAGQAAMLWSKDQGKTFNVVPTPFKMGGNEDGRSNGERLVVDPNDPRILLFGSRKNGLWKSSDQAQSWNSVGSLQSPNDQWGNGISFVLFDAKSAQKGQPTPTIYAGVSDPNAALWVSHDAGASWAPIPDQPKDLIASHGALDADGMLFVTYGNHPGPNNVKNGAVYRFDPKRKSWTNISPATPSKEDTFGYGGLALDASKPGTLMVTTIDRWTVHDDIYRSTDSGRTWKSAGKNATWKDGGAKYLYWGRAAIEVPHWMGDIDIDPFDSNRAMIVNGAGIWATTNLTLADTGKTPEWTFFNKNLEETSVGAVVAPPEGAELLTGVGDICGFYHANVDVVPSQGAYGNPSCNGTTGIDYAASNPLLVVRVGRAWEHDGKKEMHGAYSKDGGQSWQAFASEPVGAGTGGLVAFSADGKNIFWSFKGTASAVSTDNGNTWKAPAGLPIAAKLPDWANFDVQPAADRVNPKKMYVFHASKGQVYSSVDAGKSFKLTEDGLPALPEWGMSPVSVRTVPGFEGHVWITTGKGLYRSTDCADSFSTVDAIEEGYAVGFGKAPPGKNHPMVYVIAKIDGDKGVFRSEDEGKNWVKISDEQHQFGFSNIIEGDKRKLGRVYVGTPGRGILYGDPAKP